LASNVMSSSADNMLFQYQGSQPNTNPMYVSLVVSGRKDFVPANTLVDYMKDLNDPRMDAYFSNKIGGEYVGGKYGYSNSYPRCSHINDRIQTPDFPGILMTYSEVQFYLAEAASRLDQSAVAKSYYNNAITASFKFWGVKGAEDYIKANPYKDIHSIAMQSYIAAYTRGDIAYTTYRRLDYPMMNIPDQPRTEEGVVPSRFTYPISEQTLNADNYAKAADAINGDKMETRLFWDIKDPKKPE